MRNKLEKKEKEWAYEMWCLGNTQEQIASALCVCEKTIYRALRGKKRTRPILNYEIKK